MRRHHLLLGLSLLSIFALAGAIRAAEPFDQEARPLLAKYCSRCHGADTVTGFNVQMLQDPQRVRGDRRLIAAITAKLRTSQMPPKGETQPTAAERRRLMEWLESAPGLIKPGNATDPGQVVLRRLSRYEYANTIRDLFALGPKTTWKYFVPPGTPFPEDGFEYRRVSYFEPYNLPPDEVAYGYDNIGEALTLPPHLIESYFEVAATVIDRVWADKRALPRLLAVRPSAERNEEAAARENLAVLAERAFRRPVTDADLKPLVKLFALARARSESFDDAMKVPLQAVLVSPDFLFRVERGVAPAVQEEPRPLSDHELASRLSYFLWSSMPDAELLGLANQRRLSDPQVLEQQVRRMLRDPKAEALAEHFAPQWLQIQNIRSAMPDPMLFPAFYRRHIPWGMHAEVVIFFDSVIVEDRSILDLVAADSTYLNGYLAEFYGLIKKAPVGGPGFGIWRRYPLPPGRRAGVLAMAAVATMTSTPTRSSPVKRGKWVLETILGDPPPPPPLDVEELKEGDADQRPLTFRQKLERHRTSATCAACHQHMDPIGFSLENLDAIGRWRQREAGEAVDATGVLKDGAKIHGPEGLRDEILGRRRDDFARCLTEHLLTYALGRKLEWYDQATVERIGQALKDNDYRFSTLAVEIAKSRPFRYARQRQAAKH